MKFTMTLASLAVILLVFGCHPKKKVSVPDHLVGIWSTSSPKFAGRFLQFTKDSVIFQSGKEPSDIHAIEKLNHVKRGKNSSYNLTYKDGEGGKMKLSFTYDSSENGEIRVKHQRNVTWTRSSVGAQKPKESL